MSLCIYLTIYHLIFLCEKIVNVKTDTFSHDAIKQTNALIWCRIADINASLIQKKNTVQIPQCAYWELQNLWLKFGFIFDVEGPSLGLGLEGRVLGLGLEGRVLGLGLEGRGLGLGLAILSLTTSLPISSILYYCLLWLQMWAEIGWSVRASF